MTSASANFVPPTCPRCGQVAPPRGGQIPRFCPTCGQRLQPLHKEVQAALAPDYPTPAIAVWALILSFFVFVPILGVLMGLVVLGLAVEARSRIKRANGQLGGRGLAIGAALIAFVGIALQVSCWSRLI
jgi:hypothetical protein